MLVGTDGKPLTKKQVEVDGFKFDEAAMLTNPFTLMIGLICLDPTEKQKELLNKLEIRYEDADGKLIFPREEEE